MRTYLDLHHSAVFKCLHRDKYNQSIQLKGRSTVCTMQLQWIMGTGQAYQLETGMNKTSWSSLSSRATDSPSQDTKGPVTQGNAMRCQRFSRQLSSYGTNLPLCTIATLFHHWEASSHKRPKILWCKYNRFIQSLARVEDKLSEIRRTFWQDSFKCLRHGQLAHIAGQLQNFWTCSKLENQTMRWQK